MLIPLQLESAQVRILPWACAAIAVVCVVVHVVVVGSNPSEDQINAAASALIDALKAHQTAAIPVGCQFIFPGIDAPLRIDRFDDVEKACDGVLAVTRKMASHRWGLVPGRGLLQRGLLTSIFLHGSWGHLLGNMLFFWITGPVLEDRWGRRFFVAFFLVGGVVSGATQALAEPTSLRPIIGASGAIAACMGAFSILFWRKRVQMLLWLGVFGRRFTVPAWLWAGFWIGGELVSYALVGLNSPVAVLVHIGGFFAGVVVAVVVRATGHDARLSADVERSITYERVDHPALAAADAAFNSGQWATAISGFARVLRDEPKNVAALYCITRCTFATGDVVAGVQYLERFIMICIADKDAEAAVEMLSFVGFSGLRALRPLAAFRAAGLMPSTERELAAELFLRADDGDSTCRQGRAAVTVGAAADGAAIDLVAPVGLGIERTE